MIASRFFLHAMPAPATPVLSRYALLVVDPQEIFADNAATRAAVKRINEIAPQYEAAGALVYWIYNHGMRSRSIGANGYLANYKQDATNIIWPKNGYSAFLERTWFSGSKLHAHLRDRMVTDVFLCGMNFSCCERFTAIDAFGYGYNTHILMDASADNEINTNNKETQRILKLYASHYPNIHLINADEGLSRVQGRLYTPAAPLVREP